MLSFSSEHGGWIPTENIPRWGGDWKEKKWGGERGKRRSDREREKERERERERERGRGRGRDRINTLGTFYS